MTDTLELHPLLNACLNMTSAVLLVVGWLRIKSGARDAHKRAMMSAIVVSALFLVSYLARYALTGSHAFPGDGLVKTIYLVILFSHMILAALVPVGVVVAVRRALRDDIDGHKRVVRWLFPTWAYVSVTGVVVYVMLYQVAPRLASS